MGGKIYNLENRTLQFSKRVLDMTKVLTKDSANNNFIDQIVRSSSSVGANYREANDALGKKDFIHRTRIARKEAKETTYWLELIVHHNPSLEKRMQNLLIESIEITKILSAIIKSSQENNKEKDKENNQ